MNHFTPTLAAGDPLDLLTPQRVADLLKVPKSTVYALCREQRIPHMRVGRRLVFQRDALAVWITASTVDPQESFR